jgi:hypothetical protein
MNEKSLNVLETLMGNKRQKTNRLTDLLKEPEEEYTQDWYMCVPKCFNDALDIKQTPRVERVQERKIEKLIWTQGSAFSFKVGDIIYNIPSAYSLPWSEALQHMTVTVQVKQIIDKIKSTESTSDIVFEIFAPDITNNKLNKLGEYTLSQNMFVKFLINGPEGKLKSAVPHKKGEI